MIIYVTKQTAERYKINLGEEVKSPVREITDAVIQREGGDRLLEWGAKLFYFDRRKCLEVANFASKFTLFLVDIKVGDLENVGNLMAHYMFHIPVMPRSRIENGCAQSQKRGDVDVFRNRIKTICSEKNGDCNIECCFLARP